MDRCLSVPLLSGLEDQLPIECLENVFKYLVICKDIDTLRNCRLVCKQWHDAFLTADVMKSLTWTVKPPVSEFFRSPIANTIRSVKLQDWSLETEVTDLADIFKWFPTTLHKISIAFTRDEYEYDGIKRPVLRNILQSDLNLTDLDLGTSWYFEDAPTFYKSFKNPTSVILSVRSLSIYYPSRETNENELRHLLFTFPRMERLTLEASPSLQKPLDHYVLIREYIEMYPGTLKEFVGLKYIRIFEWQQYAHDTEALLNFILTAGKYDVSTTFTRTFLYQEGDDYIEREEPETPHICLTTMLNLRATDTLKLDTRNYFQFVQSGELYIPHYPPQEVPTDMSRLHLCTNLAHLSLKSRGNYLPDGDLSFLGDFPKLTTLECNGEWGRGHPIFTLDQLPLAGIPTLKRLELKLNMLAYPSVFESFPVLFPNLIDLSLVHVATADDNLVRILTPLDNLEVLTLEGMKQLTDAAFTTAIAGHKFKALKELNICNSDNGKNTFRILKNGLIPDSETLERLNLTFPKIDAFLKEYEEILDVGINCRLTRKHFSISDRQTIEMKFSVDQDQD